MELYVLLLFCLLTMTCFGHSNNKHMICREVGDVFGDVTNNEVHSRRLVGTKGEQGNMGEKGFPGLKGSPGMIHYDRVQEIVRLKVENETRLLRVKVDKLETQIQNLTLQIADIRALRVMEPHTVPQTTPQPTTVVPCVGGVIHAGICYWAYFDLSKYGETNYTEAEEICSNKKSRLADIYGKIHYDLIMNYLRGKLDGQSTTQVWTGMRKKFRKGIAYLSNGSPAPYTSHRSDPYWWTDGTKYQTRVFLLVRTSTYNTDQGMGAYPPYGNNMYGALCQTE